MKKLILEPDFVGGQGKLTTEEESALTKYFTKKKGKAKGNVETKHPTKKQQLATQ